jgi:Zn-dependent protease
MSDPRDERTSVDPVEWRTGVRDGDGEPPADDLYARYDLESLRGYEPIHPEPTWRVVVRRLWAPFAAIGFLLWKFKAAALAIFKFKLFTVAGSMLVSLAAWTLLYPWQVALGFVLLIFVHEMGHVLEARRQGLPVSAPVFIPFLGAFITMREMPHNVWREAQVALAGPIIGSLGAAAVWLVAEARDSEVLTVIAHIGFFINLFNLLPIVPLDGGRAAAAIHPALWLVGLAGLAALVVVSPNPILILILIVGAMQLWSRWRERGSTQGREYYEIAAWQRIAVGGTYLALAALLVAGMDVTHLERDL